MLNTDVEGPQLFKKLKDLADEIASYNTEEKQTTYIIRGAAEKRNNASMTTVDWIPLDGDSSLNDPHSAPSPKKVHKALATAKINHLIYPSYSNLRNGKKHRYRALIPVIGATPDNFKDYVNALTSTIQSAGVQLRPVTENYVLSQPWFITGPPKKEDRFEPLVYEGGDVFVLIGKPEIPLGCSFNKKGKAREHRPFVGGV